MCYSFVGTNTMRAKHSLFFQAFSASLVLFSLYVGSLWAESVSSLEKGIQQYQRENYDEAAASLKKAREEDPSSTRAAYYLGMTQKRLQNYPEAGKNLEDAVMGSPKVKEALLELVDALYQLNDLDPALKWAGVAQEEGIRPAQAAFLKGLILSRQSKDDEAKDSFIKAKELDPTLKQSAEYQIGLLHFKTASLDDAQKAFEEVITVDPNSDLSVMADEYMKAIKRRREEERVFKIDVGLFGEWDDNVILAPGDVSSIAIVGNTDDFREVATLSTELFHRFSPSVGLRAQYDLYYANQDQLDAFDIESHTGGLVPTFTIHDVAVSVPVQMNYTRVDRDGFLNTFSTGPVATWKIAERQLGQAAIRFQDKEFLTAPINGDEDRDAVRVAPSLGWFYFFMEDNKALFSVRYEFDAEDAEGSNWSYFGNRLNAVVQVPVFEKFKVTGSADANFQDFTKTHTFFNTERHDDTYTFSALASYEVIKNLELQFRYTHVNHHSNITIFDYDRNVISAGGVYRF